MSGTTKIATPVGESPVIVLTDNIRHHVCVGGDGAGPHPSTVVALSMNTTGNVPVFSGQCPRCFTMFISNCSIPEVG